MASEGPQVDRSPEFSVVGGLQTEGAWQVTSPLARLTLRQESLDIGASTRLLRFLVRRWTCLYSELAEVQPLVWKFGGGLRFKKRDSIEWIIFYTSRNAEVIRILEGHGVKVNPPTPRKFLFPGG